MMIEFENCSLVILIQHTNFITVIMNLCSLDYTLNVFKP